MSFKAKGVKGKSETSLGWTGGLGAEREKGAGGRDGWKHFLLAIDT